MSQAGIDLVLVRLVNVVYARAMQLVGNLKLVVTGKVGAEQLFNLLANPLLDARVNRSLGNHPITAAHPRVKHAGIA